MERFSHGGEIYKNTVSLDFSANINPLGMPDEIIQALQESAGRFDIYPDDSCRMLRKAIAEEEGVRPEWVLCGNGASDLIFRICLALRPKHAVVTAPAFSEYEKALALADCKVEYVSLKEENGFQLTEDILGILTKETDLLFLCNPNNPVGNTIPVELLQKIVDSCRTNQILLVLDECFLDFVENGEALSGKTFLEKTGQVILLKAFTKIYAMAGLRLGYCLSSNEEFLKQMAFSGQTWAVSAPAQTAGLEALKLKGFKKRTRVYVAEEREYLTTEFRKLGLTVFEPSADFIFFKGPKGLYDNMLKHGILIRLCANYIGLSGEFYRIAVKTRKENEALVSCMKQCREEIPEWQK